MDRYNTNWGGARVVLAFLLAPAAPAALVSFAAMREARVNSFLPVFGYALALHGYLPLLAIGLPLYLSLRGRAILHNPVAAALGGALIAQLPTSALLGLGLLFGADPSDSAPSIAVLALLGGLAGIVFWSVGFWQPGTKVPSQIP